VTAPRIYHSARFRETLSLGSLRYVATASPDFARTWFPRGADAKALAKAPIIIVDRPDHLQAKWAREIKGARLTAPMHWIPPPRLSRRHAGRHRLGHEPAVPGEGHAG
jgi:hypothetical protein